jgi:acyl carrier protein
MRWSSMSVSSDLAMARQHDGNWRVERMQAFDIDVRSRIIALVNAILKQNSIAAKVLPDSRLADVGLTSMDMVNLMLGVEAEFDFTIPQSEITPENFQSIETLERMIIDQLKHEKAA